MKSFTGIYKLGEGNILRIDQSGMDGDKAALCFARLNGEEITVFKIELIEQQKDIEKFINTNMKEIYKVFGVGEKLF